MADDERLREEFLRSARARFAELKALGDRALERLDEGDLRFTPDPESNSVAVIVQHVAGNMMSRWTDFLTTDGEKPDRKFCLHMFLLIDLLFNRLLRLCTPHRRWSEIVLSLPSGRTRACALPS